MSAGGSRARPRILVLATTVPAQEGDGTPAFVLTLAQALSADNDITILTPRVPGAAASERVGNVEIRRFRYFPQRLEGLAHGAIMGNLKAEPWRVVEVPPLLAAFFGAAVREIRRARPDLIHAHWLVPGGLVALALGRVFRIPYLVSGHGGDVFGLQAAPFRVLKRRVMQSAAVVAPTSNEMAAALGMSEEDTGRLVVPMGVDVERIERAVGRRAPEPGRFLFVGRLVEKKGLDVLLAALREVAAARLLVIGDGPERRRLETLARELGIASRVTFLGQQAEIRVAEELRTACALVVPSRIAKDGDRDTTPLVMSEGMAAGVPVIASRVGGLAERIVSGESGFLVEPDDPQALALALQRVLLEPAEAVRWAGAAQRMIREHLDIRVTARRYQQFIDAALERRTAEAGFILSPPR